MSAFFSYLASFGVLGIVVIGWQSGFLYSKFYIQELKERHASEVTLLKETHEREINEYRTALALERQRSEVGITAGVILRDIAGEIRKELKP